MAKSARSSGIKKNKQALKKKVFGPVETARNERQNAKLLALAKAPKEENMLDVGESECRTFFYPIHTQTSPINPANLPCLITPCPGHVEPVAATEHDDDDDGDDGAAPAAETAAMEIDHDASTAKTPRSKREVKRLQEARAQKQIRKSRKKPRNQVAFPSNLRKKSGSGKR